MALFRDQADVSVRPALAEDDASIARVQLRAWRTSHGDAVGVEVLENLDVAAVRAQWTSAITSPPTGSHHVLVACAGARVVGFAASAPTAEGVEVVALEVDPDHQRGGHASRLLTACVDLARESGATHLSTWVLEADPAREQFLASAGMGPDGASRELGVAPEADGGVHSVTERRWVAQI